MIDAGDVISALPASLKTLTPNEWKAIETALNQCLAGPLDGYDEGAPETRRKERAMERALAKVQHNLRVVGS